MQKIITNFFTPMLKRNEQRRLIRKKPEVETGDVNAANIMNINNGDQETRVIEITQNIVPTKLNTKKAEPSEKLRESNNMSATSFQINHKMPVVLMGDQVHQFELARSESGR